MSRPANALNISQAGLVAFDGVSIFTGSVITNNNVLVGGASNSVTSIAPSATLGLALISNGASSNPSFGTVSPSGGGTGVNTLTNHGVLIGQGTSPVTATAAGSSGQVLQSGGASANPTYSTATFPSTATGTGTLLRADGTNWVATTSTYPNTNAINTLLYASSANVMSALATANNGILNTSSSGVPSITASPAIGVNSGATTVTIGSNSQTALALDNGVAHGTIPLIDLYHDAATVATDYAYELDFNAQNSTPAKKTFASIQAQVSVNTASSEMGTFLVNTINAGSSQINIQVGNNLGQYRGTATNTAPPAGFIGEQIRSAVVQGSAVSSANTATTNITSISLTAGIWDVSGLIGWTNGALTGTLLYGSIVTTTGTNGTAGDNLVFSPPLQTASADVFGVIPAYRLTLSAATTTVYLTGGGNYTVGTLKLYGRISATRVG